MWFKPQQNSNDNNIIIDQYNQFNCSTGTTCNTTGTANTNTITSVTTITKKKWKSWKQSIHWPLIIATLIIAFLVLVVGVCYYHNFNNRRSLTTSNNNNNKNNNIVDIGNLQRIPLSTSSELPPKHEETCDPSLGCKEDANKLVLVFLAIFFVSIIVFYIMATVKIHYIPETTMIIIYGAIIGVIGRFINVPVIKHVTTYSSEMFFLFVLPGIIFETGFTLQRKHFFKNILPITLLATLGTFIAFFGVAIGLYLTGKIGISLELPLFESFLLSSITCATDPVATLGIFNALDVDPKLFIIVLGESIFNDAASLILFKAVAGYSGPNDIWISTLMFLGVTVGSIALGIVIALLASILLKMLNLNQYPTQETLIVLIFSYASYSLGDALHLSGILSTFVCGMTFSHYGVHNLTSDGQMVIQQFLRLLAFAFETITFIYIGITLSMYNYTSNGFSVTLFVWLAVFSILFRAASVFPIIGLLNRLGLSDISMPIQLIIALSGLRGAVSFSLVLSGTFTSDYAPYIKEHVLLLVYFTIFVFGGSTYPSLKALHLDKTQFESNDSNRSNRYVSYFNYLDQKYFIRWLTKNYQIHPQKHSDVDNDSNPPTNNNSNNIGEKSETDSSASYVDLIDDNVEMIFINSGGQFIIKLNLLSKHEKYFLFWNYNY
ncbi:hypothetical protein DFA_11656 [Cavenderia fasciculata]|uniref:Sodium/hydrogen exchanger n=1 Tax=Cavenderia fasciculata TaxID=261658 RepID=F4QDU8_CACFS|nr:uncharacterized protein DFA_11656 [Cavenderia fasciculata]EGG13895.1 hypothetical protein DFA_11656 [Cavenderia fasciculata]|eukprot:XP_004350603.1 hypothetical protein DFA_11656 [Cavenderia fasciculata]